MSDYLLLTGSTGLLGRYLLRDLLIEGKRVAVLVRPSRRESAQQRIEAILQRWEEQDGQPLPRPVILEGDLCEPYLGLSEPTRNWVAQNCREVLHSAASLTFHADGTGEPWTTNFDGTKNVLDLCKVTGITALHYVSTAYVCGLRAGTILESELDCDQDFRNDYEQSKLEAEKLVRSADWIKTLTVYRPAVISGDSQTGYTNTYHGIYLYLRLMALIVPRQPVGPSGQRITGLRLPMTGEERRNVIPVDWVSRAMAHLVLTPEAHGNTFHLAPDRCLTPREVIDAGYSYFDSTGVEYIGYQKIDPATYNSFEAEILPGFSMYNNYESTDPHFDCSNLKKYAPQHPCPVIDEAMLHTYLRFGEEDRWGKKRTPPAKFDSCAWEFLQNHSDWEATDTSFAPLLGIDLIGPGGGQWTVRMSDRGQVSCIPGLDSSARSNLCMSVKEFWSLIEACQLHPETKNPLQRFLIDHVEAPKRDRIMRSVGARAH